MKRTTSAMRCCECKAITRFTSSENWSASRRKCSGCGSLFLENAKDVMDADRAASKAGKREPRARRKKPVHADQSPEARAARRIAWMKRQREDFLARKKHGILRPELRRPTTGCVSPSETTQSPSVSL